MSYTRGVQKVDQDQDTDSQDHFKNLTHAQHSYIMKPYMPHYGKQSRGTNWPINYHCNTNTLTVSPVLAWYGFIISLLEKNMFYVTRADVAGTQRAAGAYLEGGRTGAPPPKLSKIVATICQILRLKCTKFNFGWGSAPDPTGELTEITDNGMKVWNLSSWLSGKSLKLLPPDVIF